MKNHNRMAKWHLVANYLLNNNKNEEYQNLLDRMVKIQDDVLNSWHYDEPHISFIREIVEKMEVAVSRKMYGEWYEVEFTSDGKTYIEDFDTKEQAMKYYLYHYEGKDIHQKNGKDYKIFKVEDGYRTEF